jgi:hypothetical protein
MATKKLLSKQDTEAEKLNLDILNMKQELLKSKLKYKEILIQLLNEKHHIKICSKCKLAKISSLFNNSRRECKACLSKRHAQYYLNIQKKKQD